MNALMNEFFLREEDDYMEKVEFYIGFDRLFDA